MMLNSDEFGCWQDLDGHPIEFDHVPLGYSETLPYLIKILNLTLMIMLSCLASFLIHEFRIHKWNSERRILIITKYHLKFSYENSKFLNKNRCQTGNDANIEIYLTMQILNPGSLIFKEIKSNEENMSLISGQAQELQV